MSAFEFEKAVAAWRQNLERSGSFLEEDLDELEAHLRDHVDALTQNGRSAQDAFDAALRRLGPLDGIESEYRKVRLVKSKRKRSLFHAATREWELTKNYLITALRNVRRHKSYAFINVSGLAVGIAACLLIGLYVSDELSYDRFHVNVDRIAAVGQESRGRQFLSTPYPLASTLESALPEVERGVRILQRRVRAATAPGAERATLNAAFTDAAFLDVFSFPMLAGSPEHALADPNSVIVTRAVAERMLGSQTGSQPGSQKGSETGSQRDSPAGSHTDSHVGPQTPSRNDAAAMVGKSILLETSGGERPLTVTGVVENPPAQSTFQFDVISPLAGLPDDIPREGSWGASMYRTYVLLESPSAFEGLDERITRVVDRHDTREESPSYPAVQLADLYLSGMYPSSGFRGSMRYVYIFTTVALLILLVAAINYVNLATALAARRTREVGVRKTIGAMRSQLVRQFTVESILLSVVALALALGLSRLFLSAFNHLFGKDLQFLSNIPLLLGLSAGCVAVGAAAGGYPALLLSGLRPMSVLAGNGSRRLAGKGRFRQGLIIFQFAVSVALIVGTAVIHRQLDFAQSKHLGFDGEQVATVDLIRPFWQMREDIQRRASAHPAVVQASVANAAPASTGVRLGFRPEEVSPETRTDEDMIVFVPAVVDYHYIETLGLRVLAGRAFSPDRRSDATQAYILNETAVRAIGWTVEEAVGKPFRLAQAPPAFDEMEGREAEFRDPDSFGTVIGVVEDFHIQSLHQEIAPVVLQVREDASWSSQPLLLAKLSPTAIRSGLDHLRSIVEHVAPDMTFKYEFLDDRFDAMYREEERLGRIFTSFGVLAVFLACLGLFGLSAYAAESRTKEIGIRKVLGASVRDVVSLLSRSFVLLVVVGFLIAGPVSYVMMDRWLEDFAYRIEVSPALILMVGLVTLALALTAVIYQSAKAALRNPVESLRYE